MSEVAEAGTRRIVRRVVDPIRHDLPPDLHPVLTRLYLARQLTSATELAHGLDRLEPPDRLAGIDAAVALLRAALVGGERILIVADFDADGATSCALAVRALRALGAAHVDYLVPNRFEYGYGLTPEIVAVAAERHPDLLVTVDNGISSLEGVAAARARGMRVLITDHHLAGAMLPAADAIVNPNQPGDGFLSKHLAGVGVIFYVMLALRARLRAEGWYAARGLAEPRLAELLDLVALGTVADVVPLDRNNRILVAQGLGRINQGQACAGIRALLSVAGRAPGRLTATDLGFVIGPRLNAAGRLTDMSLGIACLLIDDDRTAREMAARLDQLNRERRAIEADMQVQALELLDALRLDGELQHGLCLYDPAWHQGVIGILAARIRERVNRPVIAFAPAGDGSLKGSARSVPGVHVRDVLDAVAARHPELLHKFGGHAMAAGLSLDPDRLDAFAAAFAAEVGRHADDDSRRGCIVSDGELSAADFDLGLAECLREAGPWGQGFPEPVFDGEFEVLTARVVGDKHLKLQLRAPGGRSVDAIAFNQARAVAICGQRVRLAYRLDVNEYQGARNLQLIVFAIQTADGG